MEIKEATTEEEILACFSVVKELHPRIATKEELLRQVKLQNSIMGYRLIYIKDEETGQVASILGFSINHFLWAGKMLSINDLSTLSSARRRGYGKALVQWVIQLAKKEKCEQIEVVNAYNRNEADRLFLNCGLNLNFHHFVMKI